ncbi:hypothetical protein ACFPN2_21215 [Steroidobacter flavus]|uniref:Uncharacterized protein n=1 Tax=Steroidobacter flavus TaxID=1842136 RepID=A0ABV8SXE9_9GAMM
MPTDAELAVFKAQPAVVLHLSHLIQAVLDDWQMLGEATRAGTIPLCGHLHLQRFMQALVIVNIAPAIEVSLAVVSFPVK